MKIEIKHRSSSITSRPLSYGATCRSIL